MPDPATTLDESRSCPVTTGARLQLVEEIARLRRHLTALTGQGLEEGIIRLPVSITARRLEALGDLLERAELVDDTPCVAVGRTATVRDAHGETTSVAIVLPGEGDPATGCISADSPLGRAVLGARAGDVVEVRAPAGSWSVTVVAVG
jgi:transcription elongation GreA/GreB family factor